GLFRLLGTRQTTGFKAEGSHGSFWDRLVPNIAELGATYAILAIGGGCAVLLLWGVLRHRPAITALSPDAAAAAKIIALWAVCACGYVGYAVAFGSLEEQMFYIAAAPCAAALTIGVFLIRRRGLRRTAAAGVIVVMAVQATAWVLVHTSTDDVYAQMLERMPTVAVEGSTMSVTEETGQFVITGYDLGQWVTVPELQENEVDYVLLSDRLVENGYGIADPEFAAEVRDNGSLVLSVEGRESDLQLYDVREWTGAADPDSPTTEDAS
ncbi:hypothetical protein, partial [Marisediminicola senii]|uniref:hypothetical protein n=1 Tax=Marisediminicola senii TaxID=2711233 RepID=UPI0013EE0166